MTQELAIQKISGTETVAHESMHVAAFIYYIIRDYKGKDFRLLNEIFDWTLSRVTIVEDEESAGCFYHRNWDAYTKEANKYCCFAGYIGGYLFTKETTCELTEDVLSHLDTLTYLYHRADWMNQEELERHYRVWGASGDLKKSDVENYAERLRYIRSIIRLLRHSKVFRKLFVDCMTQLESKHTLWKEELVELAKKYEEEIYLESFSHKIPCISLNQNRPMYNYYV